MKPTGEKNIVEIRPSRWLGLFLCATHLSAMIVVFASALRYPFCLVLLLPLVWSWARGWSVHVTLSHRTALEQVEWDANGAWNLSQRRGGQISAKLIERSFVSPWMTLLSFSCQHAFRRHVILLADNSDADQVRRLRVRLRLERSNTPT